MTLELERYILDQIDDNVVITNKEGCIEYVNPAFERNTGFSAKDVVGKTPSVIKSNHNNSIVYEKLWNTILQKKVYRSVIENQKANGEYYFEQKTISPILDEHGEIKYFVSTGKDITELMYLKQNLEHLAEEQAKKGIEQEKILFQQSKLVAMSDVIGAIAHQWRQPLNILGMKLQLLEDDFEDSLIDKAYLRGFVDESMHLIENMSKIIDEFRAYFNPNSKKALFSVQGVIHKALDTIQTQFSNHDIAIEVSGEDFEIEAVESEFEQVILNILYNAKDAIQANETDLRLIKIDIHDKIVTIEDSGGGIPDEIRNRVFDPYFSTKFESNGKGLGLYVSRVIIEDSIRGRIWVENGEMGARFIISLDENY